MMLADMQQKGQVGPEWSILATDISHRVLLSAKEAVYPQDRLRNVLIYFDPPTKTEVVDRVLRTLRPGGLFFMGTAEGRVNCQTPISVIIPGAYRKASAA